MSESYSPDPGVEPQPPYDTVFLSQRDLGIRVPINFVTTPGVSFSSICFPSLRYEDDESGNCLSNLLAVGFRRFEIDLYWDEGRKVWSFCPIAMPSVITNVPSSSTITLSFSSSTTTNSTSAPTSSALFESPASILGARQITSDTSSRSVATSVVSGSPMPPETSLGSLLPTATTVPNSTNVPLVSIGPYICTTTINLSTFTSQILDYIQKTENTLGAHLLYVILNIHAAASNQAPESPAPAPTSLPAASNFLGSTFLSNFSAYLYTQNNLRSDRANLNDSWYVVTEENRPIEGYYKVTTNEYGVVSTEDGWPSAGYIELAKSKRLLLGWGTVDPQMAGYNFSGDSGIIFPNGYIQNFRTDVNASSDGQVLSGCFLSNSTDGLSLSQRNSSWAVDANIPNFNYPTSLSSDIYPLLNLTLNTTNCGISPILNFTLLNSTANNNYVPYQNHSYSTIWSWAPGEPRSYSSPSDADTPAHFRCATTSPKLGGRWVVSDCSQKYYAACRANGQPYNWSITTYSTSYSFAQQACPADYYFAAPRTALENAYLAQALRDSHRDFDGHGPWVDFNSLDVEACWTTGGANATCPYSQTLEQTDDLRRRIILIPTIAAVIVLIVTILTVFVKVAGYRRTVRRTVKRTEGRAHNGFVYEGVPS